MNAICQELEQQAGEVVAGEAVPERAAVLRAHARQCATCERTLARQSALESALRELPAAPSVSDGPLGAPSLPATRPARLPVLRLVGATAAAAVLLVGIALFSNRHRPALHVAGGDVAAQPTGSDAAPVHVYRVVDGPGTEPVGDDGLIALTSGLEAVAMRWPAGRR